MGWDPDADGVLTLPGGSTVRGRALRRGLPAGDLPEFGVYLLGRAPDVGWPSRWVRWPDFRLPREPLEPVLREVLDRVGAERVELACGGGRGRTGTALACLVVLDGVPAAEAVAWVRARYHPRAVETLAQRRFVERFGQGRA